MENFRASIIWKILRGRKFCRRKKNLYLNLIYWLNMNFLVQDTVLCC